MIKIEKTEVFGWETAIRGMRNPMNSWEKSDSFHAFDEAYMDDIFVIGKNDLALMKKLAKAGTDHRKFMRMIVVYCDITAPLYWWKEFDTYKVGTVANSCSTMHKIAEKEFTTEDFSCEHLWGNYQIDQPESEIDTDCYIEDEYGEVLLPFDFLHNTITILNVAREKYLETKDKKYWWQMIQLLPSSYNQKRTVMLNYEVIANMYKSRKSHKLDEWVELMTFFKENLPYSELFTGE